jgi:error-prone DNA polymerase
MPGWGTDWPDRHGLRFDVRLPDARGYGIRIALADVKGISDAETDRIIASRPYHSLADLWHRARPSRPIAERLILAGGLDTIYGIGAYTPAPSRGRVTRRDLLLQVADLDRWSKATRASSDRQLPLDLGDAPQQATPSGLPELSAPERVAAELEILGLDASGHVMDYYRPMLADLRATQSRTILGCRNGQEILVAGVKVATQTPPVRSGRRVVFLTLDDPTGPVDATFFEDAQGPYALTVFNSWLMLVRGQVRRTGPRGVSLRATGAWELGAMWQLWHAGGAAAVIDLLAEEHFLAEHDLRTQQKGTSRSRAAGSLELPPRAVGAGRDDGALGEAVDPDAAVEANRAAAARTRRRVLVHASGYRQSPYADIRPQGEDVRASRKLWHASPGSSGR